LLLYNLSISMTPQDLGYYAGAIFLFGLMIMAHEFGHFIIAKRSGIRVEEFSFGFGPKILSKKKGETVYSWRAVPLGGFVHMVGEDADKSDDSDPGSFQNKSFFARMAVVAAGPAMNYILAFIIFFLLFLFLGEPEHTTELGEIRPGFPAYKAGLREGDIVQSINGTSLALEEGMKMRGLIKSNAGKELDLVVNRNGNILNYKVTPTSEGQLGFLMSFGPYTNIIESVKEGSAEEKAGLKKGDEVQWVMTEGKEKKELTHDDGMLLFQTIRAGEGQKVFMGVKRDNGLLNIEFTPLLIAKDSKEKQIKLNFYLKYIYRSQNPLKAVASAIRQVYMYTIMVVSSLSILFSGEVPLSKSVSGPVGIVAAMRDVGTQKGIYDYIVVAAILNIGIGFFNLLPIPALDGMRLVFLAVGAMRRKTVNQQTEGIIHYIGFAVLFLIMIAVTCLDIHRLWSGESIIPK